MKKIFITILVLGIGLLVLMMWAKKNADNTSSALQPEAAAPVSSAQIEQQLPQQDVNIQKIPMHGTDQASSRSVPGKEAIAAKFSESTTTPKTRKPQAQELRTFSGHSAWKIWPQMTALKASDAEIDSEYGKVSGFTLVRSGNGVTSTEESFSAESPLVVYNPRMNRAGVVTGSIKLMVHDNAAITELEKSYDLKVLNAFPEIQLFFVTGRVQPYNLKATFAALRADASVKSAEIEIVSKTYEKK